MKILGIGNALVDILAPLHDELLLKELDLEKGGMHLIDADGERRIAALMEQLHHEKATGGSAANMALALAHLQQGVGYIGHIGNGANGCFFAQRLAEVGVENRLRIVNAVTGTANTFITPDGERTFATYLGAAATLQPADIVPSLFEGYDLVHIEGYFIQVPQLLETVCRVAKECGLQTSLDLSSYNIVQAQRQQFRDIVASGIDIVFANEEEAAAFSQNEDPMVCVRDIASLCRLAVVKMGGKGSCAMAHSDKNPVQISSRKVEVVDTTAAGDFFAGGFLHAYGEGRCLEDCLRCGALLAEHVIQVVGTQVSDEMWARIKMQNS